MTEALPAQVEATQVDIGWVLRSTFAIVRKRAAALVILAAVFDFLPQSLTAFLPESLSRLDMAANLPGLIFDGAGALLAYRELSGGPSLGANEAMRAAMRRFGSLWGLGIISGIAVLVGLVLLIVPGIILLVGWMPANAVLMVEDKPAYASLQRAWSLTKGARWRLAALLGLYVAGAVLLVGTAFPFGFLGSMANQEVLANRFLDFFWSPLIVSAVSIFGAVGTAAVYAALRTAKEGGAGDIAEVFS
ncbi:MAG: hypothetical protein ACHP7N_09075 [Caulobacterales bacterium]